MDERQTVSDASETPSPPPCTWLLKSLAISFGGVLSLG